MDDELRQLWKRAMTPLEALELLRAGNHAFLSDAPLRPALDRASRLRLAAGQSPFAAYVSCSDSRVPPELLFGRGLGELFIIRNAGNTLDTAAIGSLEFAVSVLGVPLIVVMGHEACGAVQAAVSVVQKNARFSGSIGKMIQPIIPAVLEADLAPGADIEAAVLQNVRRVVRELREEASPILLAPQATGALIVVGAYYRLGSGEVDFFDVP
ncbi:carbonic anhydrase [Allostella humosa]|nr:carbonic anhydrase [Stella humosa]